MLAYCLQSEDGSGVKRALQCLRVGRWAWPQHQSRSEGGAESSHPSALHNRGKNFAVSHVLATSLHKPLELASPTDSHLQCSLKCLA